MPANDPWRDRKSDITAGPRRMVAVTPSDTVDLPEVTRSLFIGTSGDVAVIGADNTVSVIYGDVFGRHVGQYKRVLVTGTTASRILAEY